MSRIWWATIVGLIAGAALLAMVQRGCAAGAEVDRLRAAERLESPEPDLAPGGPRNLAPIQIEAATPNLGQYEQRRPEPTPEPPRPAQTANPTITPDPPAPGLTRAERREEMLSRYEARRRAAEERRRQLEERRAQSRELVQRLAVDSGQLQPQDARRVTRPINRASAEEAQRRFRQQLTNASGRGGAGGSGAGAPGGSAEEGGPGGQDGDAGDGDPGTSDLLEGLPDEARQALEDLGGIPDAPGPRVGSEPDRTETRFQSREFPTPEELAPIPHWEPVATGRTPDGRAVASSDLYLGFLSQPSVPVITSREENGLTARGGEFFAGRASVESQRGPTASSSLTSASDGLAAVRLLNTFLTLGGAEPFFTPGSERDPAAFGATVGSEWATTDFNNLEVIQDRERFGDDRFYIWVGRFAAADGVGAVEGTLGVTWIDLASFASVQIDVPIPSCASCWSSLAPPPSGGDDPDPTDPDPTDPGDDPGDDPGEGDPGTDPDLPIASATISPSTLAAGQTAQGVVTLAAPAPAGGVVVGLSVSEPSALSLSSFELTIPEGATQGVFSLTADEVFESVTAIVAITLDAQTLERRVTVLPPTAIAPQLDRLSIVPRQIRGGLTATGTIRLLDPAPESGVVIELASSAALATLPPEVLVAAGDRRVDFTISTAAVDAEQTVLITARLGDQERSADLLVTGDVFGDVNRDGVVDSFDLAALLMATVSEFDPDADLDDDGDVDLDDLQILVDLLDSEGGLEPGGSSDLPLVARWLPVMRSDCAELEGFRTADLYLGYLDPPSIVGVASPPDTGLSVVNGFFYQHPLGNNAPPNPSFFDVMPCLRYDSYLTVGDAPPLVTPTFGDLNAADWGQTLVAEWLPSPGASIQVIQDPDIFGDDRHYVRILRATVPVGVRSLAGMLETITIAQGQSAVVDRDVVVHHCGACWGQYDLNADGVVSDLDLEIMIGLLGAENEPEADLDGDGVVDIDDLRLLIAAIGT